jgi:ABC-2 type transport system ATP-binding protein
MKAARQEEALDMRERAHLGRMGGDGESAILAVGLRKRFGKTWALGGVDLDISPGTVCGLLGPNGAGKTTMVRILTTLLRPDEGYARVAGFDVVRQAEQVRYHIGLAGQQAALDELLTGRANLVMIAQLYHLPTRTARQRADEMLERFGLTDAAGRIVKTYSGGMRRRLDLAVSLIAAPPVLFLDEPTTGLDPRSRISLWAMLDELVKSGTTLLLTTQYMEEADRLADSIVVIEAGHVIASGSPAALKATIGGERITVVVRDSSRLADAAGALSAVAGVEPDVEVDLRRLTILAADGAATLARVVRDLDTAGIAVDDLALRRATLDDVFLRLTGRASDKSENQTTETEIA